MSETMTKTNLLAAMQTGRQAWQQLLEQIDEAAMLEPGVEGIWSVKDIVVHIAGYEHYFSAYLFDLRQELSSSASMTARLDEYYQQQLNLYRRVRSDFPEHLDDIQEDQLNALFVVAAETQSVHEVLVTERQAYERLLLEVEALPEATLTSSEQNQGRALIERIPNQCYAHYQMHMPEIERWFTQRKLRE